MVNLSEVSKLRQILWSTTRCGPFKHLNPIKAIESMIRLLKYAYFDLPYSGPENHGPTHHKGI
ncbi:S ribonuclease [Pyrus ussuriensis x Pyrus communis]|uniref:S ribonuclease n=1 Tax=Pyrus ussuriensis x Pyrus communis TaxID=2448454 RepID=A0A5N5GAC8_9ROSA|nr:S ribonuclease [Pyrus ussuriensis x Pyrus communis]